MSEEMTKYVKEFVGSELVKSRLKDIVLYIGQRCENDRVRRRLNGFSPPSNTSQIELDLLIGSKILEQPTGRTFTLTKERGEKLYEWIKGEEFKKGSKTKEESKAKEKSQFTEADRTSRNICEKTCF
jgi:hypothetical protein